MALAITESTPEKVRDVIVAWLEYCAKIEGNKLSEPGATKEQHAYAAKIIADLARQLGQIPVIDPNEENKKLVAN